MTPRLATALIFFVNGAAVGTWIAQLPWLTGEIGASKTQIGLMLLCAAAGALVSMPLTGQLLTRVSSRRIVTVAAPLYSLVLPLLVLAPTVVTVAAVAVAFGAANGIVDVSMNGHGVAVERAHGRPIMSSLHAGWSIGGLAGASAVAIGASIGLDPRVEVGLVAIGLCLLSIGASSRLGIGSTRAAASASRIVLPSRRVLPLALLAVLVALVEGGIGDWAGIYLRRDLGSDAGVAAAGFAAYALGMAVGRLWGDRLNARRGAAPLLQAGMVVVTLALAVMLVTAAPWTALVGLVVAGAGVANALPLLFSAAGHIPPSGPSLSAVFTVGYAGFLAGPPLIGFLADGVGLPVAFALLGVVSVGVALVAPRAPGLGGIESMVLRTGQQHPAPPQHPA